MVKEGFRLRLLIWYGKALFERAGRVPATRSISNYGEHIWKLTPKSPEFKANFQFFYERDFRPNEFHCPFYPPRFGPDWIFEKDD